MIYNQCVALYVDIEVYKCYIVTVSRPYLVKSLISKSHCFSIYSTYLHLYLHYGPYLYYSYNVKVRTLIISIIGPTIS